MAAKSECAQDMPWLQKPILEYTKKGGHSKMTPEQKQAADDLFKCTTNKQQRYRNLIEDTIGYMG